MLKKSLDREYTEAKTFTFVFVRVQHIADKLNSTLEIRGGAKVSAQISTLISL